MDHSVQLCKFADMMSWSDPDPRAGPEPEPDPEIRIKLSRNRNRTGRPKNRNFLTLACSMCNNAFINTARLKVHERTNTGEAIFMFKVW